MEFFRDSLPVKVGAIIVITTIVAKVLFSKTKAQKRLDVEVGSPTDVNRDYGPYQPFVVTAPILYGWKLRAFVHILHTKIIGNMIIQKLLVKNRYTQVRQFAGLIRHGTPLYTPYKTPSAEVVQAADAVNQKSPFDPRRDAAQSVVMTEYHIPYASGALSPVDKIEEVIATIESEMKTEKNPFALNHFVAIAKDEARAAAKRSADRFKRNAPISVLDGVPIGVKTAFAVKGAPHTEGTLFLKDRIAEADAEPIRKLRAAGAVIIGVTSMHEIGCGTTGWCPLYGSTRNPFNRRCHTGGSSSGDGSAVGSGVVPISIGGDGGGSVRIPAAFCGVVGLKATWGRVPCKGEMCHTISHCGPLAATVEDAAIAYYFMAATGEEEGYLPQPKPHYNRFSQVDDLKDLRVGVFSAWNDDTIPSIKIHVKTTLAKLQARGATLVPISIPHLDYAFLAHTVTILTEMGSASDQWPESKFEFGVPTQTNLLLACGLKAPDYNSAQIIRHWFYEYVRTLFEQKCDVILTPANGVTPPLINEEGEKSGVSNLKLIAAIMRFMYLGNLVGHPCMTFPVGDAVVEGAEKSDRVPVAMQVMATHWNEAACLRVARALQVRLKARMTKI